MDPYQLAYRAQHSTETALLKVQNDILCEIDAKRVVFIILLDLSAALDTVDHSILLQRLEKRFNIGGVALQWFSSYLSGWNSTVNVSNVLSHPVSSAFGLPQGSIMDPSCSPATQHLFVKLLRNIALDTTYMLMTPNYMSPSILAILLQWRTHFTS